MTRQKILITGASSGLGAGMARAFAAKGRDLALCARRTERLEELKDELAQRYPGSKVAIAQLDVNDHDQVPKVFAELSDALGGIDRVIVNAGIGKGAKLGSGKVWANKATIETNLVAALVQIETALEMFTAQNSGHLVLISSVLGSRGVPGVKAAYAASKAGLINLTNGLARALAPAVRVNAVAPGLVETPWTSAWSRAGKEAYVEQTMLRRAGTPADIAAVIYFLCVDAAMVTGQTITVDGGRL